MRDTFERKLKRERGRGANLNASPYISRRVLFLRSRPGERESAGFARRERRRAAKYELAREIEKKELRACTTDVREDGEEGIARGEQRETAL